MNSFFPGKSFNRTIFTGVVSAMLLLSSLLASVGAQSPHLTMGNPSNATSDTSQKDNFLMEKPYFALSYNDGKGTPNWASWRLTEADLGAAPRFPFHPDEERRLGSSGLNRRTSAEADLIVGTCARTAIAARTTI